MGWGGVITFMFLCTHRHSNLIIFLAVQQTQALLIHDQLPVGCGGVGWDNNVHVPAHTGTATSSSFLLSMFFHDQLPFLCTQSPVVGSGGMGSGGVITFMFSCTHRHSNLIIFLAVQQTQALLIHDQLPVGCGGVGVGWGNNVHVPVRTQAQQPHHLSCWPADAEWP